MNTIVPVFHLTIPNKVLRHAALHERHFALHERHVANHLMKRRQLMSRPAQPHPGHWD